MNIDNLVYVIFAPAWRSLRLTSRCYQIFDLSIFGIRKYDLVNHLGNVLTVISDKVGMKADSVWATVLSACDYYPFGLEMKGRTWTDSTYRYGFNGKEKDASFGGSAVYDYGFRIYNPEIGKFLSVDPLTKKYPELTPYQFASNRPIDGIDLDGLEFYKKVSFDPATRKPVITITAAVEIINETNLSLVEIHNYKLAAKKFFKDAVSSASTEKVMFKGELIFPSKATLKTTLKYIPKPFGGASYPGGFDTQIGSYDKNGKLSLNSIKDVAQTITHEVLHQGGVEHPTNILAPPDVHLNKVDSGDPSDPRYKSTSSTSPDIFFNVMLYGFIELDGKKVNDVRGKDENAFKIEYSQIMQVIESINKKLVNGEAMLENAIREVQMDESAKTKKKVSNPKKD